MFAGVSCVRMRFVLGLVLVVLWSTTGSGFNIDTQQPIVRAPPLNHMDQEYDLFGYESVLHSRQVHTPSTTTSQALGDTVILVGAPNGTAIGAQLQNTGIIFECPLSPGECAPFVGNQNSANDRRLYDVAGNRDELKEGQQLGVAMDSTGDRFIVCGHRYRHDFFYETGGVCFLSNRELRNFQRYQPCFDESGRNRLRVFQSNSDNCGAGASVSLLSNNNIAFGAPATGYNYNQFRGASIIYNTNTDRYHFSERNDPVGHTPTEGDKDSAIPASFSDYHRGYSLVRGRIFSNNPNDNEDIVVGMPRGQAGSFTGAFGVHRQGFRSQLFRLRNSGNIVRYNYLTRLVYLFEGDQLGSYFGGVVAAVDVNNDGYDEVFVAATLYGINRQLPEAGRVTVYLNTGGSLSSRNTIVLEGPRRAFARFGYAMTNLGDINADGFNDVAISAPFSVGEGTDFSGAVYIYSGSSGSIRTSPSQVIEGSSLNLIPSVLNNLTSFGSSLFSLDVDNNGFRDLLVGAFQSRKVFVLRARPILNVISTIAANITSFNDTSLCTFEGTPRRCFSVEVCLRTTGRGFPVSQQFDVNYNLTTDSRVFFGEGGLGSTRVQGQVRSTVNQSSVCNDHVLYLSVNVLDIATPLAVNVAPFVPSGVAQVAVSNGNEQPADLANRPSTTVSGQTQALVLTSLDCGEDGICTTDLTVEQARLSYVSRTITGMQFTKIIVGQVTDVIVSFDFYNGGAENAYRTIATVTYSTAFAFSRIEGTAAINCMQETHNTVNVLTCEGSALLEPAARIPISVRLVALEGRLQGTEGSVDFQINITSNSNEVDPDNNIATLTAAVASLADVQITLSASSRQFLAVEDKTTDFGLVRKFSDIGRQVQVNVTATNLGPSVIRSSRIRIQWPLAHRCSGDSNFLFYLSSVQLESLQGSCTVDPPDALDYFNVGDIESGEGVDVDTERVGRAEQNSSHPFTVSEESGTGIDCTSEDVRFISVTCDSPDDYCIQITCDISSHQVDRAGIVSITGYVDDAFFSNEPRDWNVIVSANYTIMDEFVTEITGAGSRPNDGQLAVSVISQNLVLPPPDIPIWVIVVPIVLGLLFIVTVIIILYFCGFFKRKHWKKLQEEKEEQSSENGSTSGNETNTAENGNDNGTDNAPENGNGNESGEEPEVAVKDSST